MSHVHTRQASEMAFMDSSGSLDRHNNPVFFRCTHHPSGAFGGKGPQNGPDIFMTDDNTAQRQALQTDWKQATLCCAFTIYWKQHGDGC